MYQRDYTNYWLIISGLLLILLFIYPSSAFTVNVVDKGTNFIQWSWVQNPTTNVSIDGILVCNLDPNSQEFILSDLGENECHTIAVYTDMETGTATTCTDVTSTTTIVDFTASYLIFIVAIICILIGTKIPILAWAGAGFAIMGLGVTIAASFWAAFIFMVVFCAAVIIALARSGE